MQQTCARAFALVAIALLVTGCAARFAAGRNGVELGGSVFGGEQQGSVGDAGLESSLSSARTAEVVHELLAAPAAFWSWLGELTRSRATRGLGPGEEWQPPTREEWLRRAAGDKQLEKQLKDRLDEFWAEMGGIGQ